MNNKQTNTYKYKNIIKELMELRKIKASDQLRTNITILSTQSSNIKTFSGFSVVNSFAQIVFFLFIILTLGGGISTVVAKNSKPGDLFYPLKAVVNKVQNSLGTIKPERENQIVIITPTVTESPTPEPDIPSASSINIIDEGKEDDIPELKGATQSGKEDDKNEDEEENHGIDEVLQDNPQININDAVNNILGTSTSENKPKRGEDDDKEKINLNSPSKSNLGSNNMQPNIYINVSL